MSKKGKLAPLEEGLLLSGRAIDNQIARDMQRSPAEREEHGVQKWQPHEDKVEKVTSFLLNAFQDEALDLDGFVVLSQAWVKALYLIMDDLGYGGLGKIRSSYAISAMEKIRDDVHRALSTIGPDKNLN